MIILIMWDMFGTYSEPSDHWKLFFDITFDTISCNIRVCINHNFFQGKSTAAIGHKLWRLFFLWLKTTMWTGCFIHFSFIKVLYFAEAETLEFWKQQLKNKSLFIFRRKLDFSQTLSSFAVSIFKKATIPKLCSPKG